MSFHILNENFLVCVCVCVIFIFPPNGALKIDFCMFLLLSNRFLKKIYLHEMEETKLFFFFFWIYKNKLISKLSPNLRCGWTIEKVRE